VRNSWERKGCGEGDKEDINEHKQLDTWCYMWFEWPWRINMDTKNLNREEGIEIESREMSKNVEGLNTR